MKKKQTLYLIVILIMVLPSLGRAKHINLKLSFNSNSIGDGDINSWIRSANSLWRDWNQQKGGQLNGEFAPIDYGFNFEVELRVPLYAGFALNIGGSQLSSNNDGQVSYSNATGTQHENQILSNRVKATALKFGLSYSHPLPFFQKLSVVAGVGRHIRLIQYKSEDSYELSLTWFGEEFNYWYQKQNTYNSEALGYYVSLGTEYELLDFIAVFLEAEKIWSKADGFKGRHSYKGFLGHEEFDEGGKASLYFYESNQSGLDQYYSILTGHKKRPEESYIRDVRQGELNFNDFSFKIGIIFKF